MHRSLPFHNINMSRKLLVWGIALVLGVLMLSACQPAEQISKTAGIENNIVQTSQPETTPDAEFATSTAPTREERLVPATPKVTPVDLSQSADEPITGEVPQEILEEIQSILAVQLDITTEEIQVLRAQAVLWPDGSLGCPQPGEYFTQAPVDGYWVTLQVQGVEFDYRVTDSGYFRLCPGGGENPILPPNDNPPKE